MDSGKTIALLILVDVLMFLIGVGALIAGYMAAGWIFFIVAFVLIFSLVFISFTPKVKIEDSILCVKAPFVDLKIPLSSITAAELRPIFNPGTRTAGMSTFRGWSGDFCNTEFANYKLAASSELALYIVIRYGADKVAVFNTSDSDRTRAVYEQISRVCSGSSVATSFTREDTEQKNRSRRNTLIAFLVVLFVTICVAAVGIMFFVGHADASLDDDSVTIDATMLHRDILYTDISSADLRDNMDYGTRISGFSSNLVDTGTFNSVEFGNYTLSLNKDTSKCIVLHLNSAEVVAFNVKGNDATSDFYADLLSRI